MKKYCDAKIASLINKNTFGKLIDINDMRQTVYDDQLDLPKTSLHPEIINVVVETLSKYLITSNIDEAFKRCVKGAKVYFYKKLKDEETYKNTINLLTKIKGLDKRSVFTATYFALFERFCAKNPTVFDEIPELKMTEADYQTIVIMVSRTVRYFTDNGPVCKINFNFKSGKPQGIGKSELDFLTRTSLYDLSLSNKTPDYDDVSLLLIHYVIFKHCSESKYLDIKTIGIFNPRLHEVYTYNVSKIAQETIDEVEKILGYKK